jgi:hypothetical protein
MPGKAGRRTVSVLLHYEARTDNFGRIASLMCWLLSSLNGQDNYAAWSASITTDGDTLLTHGKNAGGK